MQNLKAIRGSKRKAGNSHNKRAAKDVKEDDCGCTSRGIVRSLTVAKED